MLSSTQSKTTDDKHWISRFAFDRVLDKIGEIPKQEVLIHLIANGAYHYNSDRVDRDLSLKTLTDIFGANVAYVLIEMILLEMDEFQSGKNR